MKWNKNRLVITAFGLFLSGVANASLIGDTVLGALNDTSYTTVATQFPVSPTLVDGTGSPEFIGNIEYSFTGDERYFDVMVDVGDSYIEFWMEPTNDWGNVGGFGLGGTTLYSFTIYDMDTTGPIIDVNFDEWIYAEEGEFGPEPQLNLNHESWSEDSITIHVTWIDLERNRFNFTEGIAVVPVPAAVWLFGSGILGLIGVARRKK